MKKKKRMKKIIERQDKTIESLKMRAEGLESRLKMWREDPKRFEFNEKLLQSTEKMVIKLHEDMLFGGGAVLEGLNKAETGLIDWSKVK